ncbi:squalene-hopene cyclase [Aureimonas endophytica]|uniref:Squalene-hopene cyclase n=1 Tax=Aureimonas endophytica TaxID=2027858 RepID=A0A916ZZ92_9HYPH|nr:squalene--hopene cyclase [Aureimonas endophytica]GGE17828.1 squalene-hopene cyclase [Aureimonas endophytica]
MTDDFLSDDASLAPFAEAEAAPPPSPVTLEDRIARATAGLLKLQKPDGHFCFELEADATIPSEYVLLLHWLGEENRALEAKIGVYLRRIQGSHGGWPLFAEGAFDMSASVKAYFALKMIGDPIDAPHMRRAREAILQRGGAAHANVFTRILLALYGEIPWRGVPVMPVEIMALPRWFPFHLSKVSYWARTVLVPLLVLQALKPKAANPRGTGIAELFVAPPDEVRSWPKGPHQVAPWSQIFGGIDRVLQRAEPRFPKAARRRAIARAVAFVDQRLNGASGLGAIYPAMANAVMMYEALGVPRDDPRVVTARAAIEGLLVIGETEAYCQPCLSPVWDTALAAHALIEAGGAASDRAKAGLDWLRPLQVLDHKGDWAETRPDVRPGGWAFQYANPDYPDLDDTAVVAMAMDRLARQGWAGAEFEEAVARGAEWVGGLQSRNGGYAAFDADNTHHHLNYIPFADHGALLDPPTADVSARCISMFAQLGETPATSPRLKAAVDYLLKEQEADGSWFGRWGTNYVYGTWSALCALNAAGFAPEEPALAKAADWLTGIQNPDGGWGEDGDSYRMDYQGYVAAPSTASQTAWALLGLMAAGRVDHPAVARGIDYLARAQGADGLWDETRFTAVGFPRVFYLRYHGYSKFFPLWAMARFRNLQQSNSRRVAVGM